MTSCYVPPRVGVEAVANALARCGDRVRLQVEAEGLSSPENDESVLYDWCVMTADGQEPSDQEAARIDVVMDVMAQLAGVEAEPFWFAGYDRSGSR